MVRGNITTSGPTPHAGLGLQGYVQFTSPIRRYSDMLAHFQLKVSAHRPPVIMLLSLHGLWLGPTPCSDHSEGSCENCICMFLPLCCSLCVTWERTRYLLVFQHHSQAFLLGR